MTLERSLPDGWRWARFGAVVREVRIVTRDPEADRVTRVVGLEHLDSESLPLRRWNDLADLAEGTSFTRVFRAGQLLFGKRRAYQRKVAVPDFDGLCSSDILVLESSTVELLPEFLPHIVQSDAFFDHALGTSAGSLSPRTKWQQLAKFEFPLPPVEEQVRCHGLLSAASEVSESLGRSATAASALLNAVLLGLLAACGDVPTVDCSAIADIQVGKKLSPDKRRGLRPRPTLRAVNLRLDGLDLEDVNQMDFTPDEDEFLSIRANDILLVEGGNRDSVGAPTWVAATPVTPLYIQNTIVRLRPLPEAEILPRFLYWLWRAKYVARKFESLAVGTKLYHLGPRRVAGVLLPVPPFDVQEEWCDELDRIDLTRKAVAAHSDSTALLRRRLLNDLLAGVA